MKQGNKIILLGVTFNILLLSVSVAFSTLAWYIGSSYLEVTNMDIKIATEDFKVKPSGDDEYKYELQKEDLSQTDYFIPCSSMYSDLWQNEHLEEPIFKAGYTELTSPVMQLTGDMERHHGYFSQELMFMATTDCYISIDTDMSYVRANYAKNKEKARGLRGREGINDPAIIEKYLNSIERSIRMSLLVLNDTNLEPSDPNYYKDYAYYIIDPFKTERVNPDDPTDLREITNPTYYGGIMDALDPDLYFDDYEGKEVVYGQLNNPDKICYTEPITNDIPLKGEYRTCFDANHKKGVRMYDEAASKANGFSIVEEPSIPLAHADDPDIGIKIPLKGGVDKRIVLSIYLEGWDLDNTDLTTDGAFETCIAFKMTLR